MMLFKVKPIAAAFASCIVMLMCAEAAENPVTMNTVTLGTDINTSFSGTYLSYVLTPKKSNDKFNPMTVRMFPSSFHLLSGGINFQDIQYNNDYFQLTVYKNKTPLYQIMAVRNTSAGKMKSSIINSEFTGNLISAKNIPDTPDNVLFENITNECSVDNKIKTKAFGTSVIGYLDCGSRSTHLFYSRLAPDTPLPQPYESPFETAAVDNNDKNNKEVKDGKNEEKDTGAGLENIVLVHVLSESAIDYRQPFSVITGIGLPVNSINRYLSPDFAKLSPDEQSESIREALTKDVSFTHARNDDLLTRKLLDPAYTVKEMRKLPHSGITRSSHNNGLGIRNRAENYFSNNITVFANSAGNNISTIIIAATATPMILSTSDIDSLADEISRDPTCKSSGVNTLQLTNEDAMEIDCEVPFGTGNLPRHYYLISEKGRFSVSKKGAKNTPSYERVQIIMLAGSTANREMDDVVNSLHLSENYRWHLSLNDPTEQDLDTIYNIPRTRKWHDIYMATDEDDRVNTAWYRFAMEGAAIYDQNRNQTPEAILKLLSACAEIIAADFPDEPENK